MDGTAARRFRGLAFLVSGAVAAGLIVYAVASPGSLDGLSPLPLLVLLALTAVVAFWQAVVYLR